MVGVLIAAEALLNRIYGPLWSRWLRALLP